MVTEIIFLTEIEVRL